MKKENVQIYWNCNLNACSCFHYSMGAITFDQEEWFEGFLLDLDFGNDMTKRSTGLIFGTVSSNEIMQIFYCRDDLITRFQCTRNNNLYTGKCYSISPNSLMEKINGDCNVRTEDTNYSEIEIQNKTQLAKLSIAKKSLEYYELILRNRDKLIEYEEANNKGIEKMTDIGLVYPSSNQQKQYSIRNPFHS